MCLLGTQTRSTRSPELINPFLGPTFEVEMIALLKSHPWSRATARRILRSG